MDIVIYGIIGALAILVCWLLDIYSPTMGEESISMYSTDSRRSEKSRVILPTCCICQKIRDYQGVLFTHAFCHECALIHYAEFYQGIELESTSTH